MKCKHCGIEFFPSDEMTQEINLETWGLNQDYSIVNSKCPSCKELNILLYYQKNYLMPQSKASIYQVWPIGFKREFNTDDIPEAYLGDYIEACVVLPFSTKASAALSRRCLQSILSNHFRIDKKRLDHQIEKAINDKIFSAIVCEQLNYLREIGNFAVHEIKSTHTNEIIDVEQGEAEWCIELLEAIFLEAFQTPAQIKRKRAEFDKKINEAGRTPLDR